MKPLTKMTTLLLCFCLVMTLIVGCASKEIKNSSNDAAQNQEDVDSNNQTEEKQMNDVTYKIMIKQGIAEYPADGGEAKEVLQRVWKERLGITNTDYEVILASGSDYNTKLNTMLAGGDIPDYFQINIQDLQMYVDNNMIAPIDDYLEKMPNYKKLISTKSGQLSHDNFMIDGKHYGIVNTFLPGDLNSPSVNGLILRTDWLEKLGLEQPKTLDQLHDVLYAFTYNDPDGNNVDDTYGLGGSRDRMFSSVFGAYGIYLNGFNSWMEVDGQLVHATVMPETKEVLEILRKWYEEGIIDPDKFVIEGKQSRDKFIGSKFGAWEQTIWWAHFARDSWKGAGTEAECAIITPIEGPDGKKGFPVNPIQVEARVFSKKMVESKDPERFFDILNLMAEDSKDGSRLVQYGVEGEHYDYIEDTDTIVKKSESTNLYKIGFSNPIRWPNIIDRRWIAPDDPRAADFMITNNQEDWLLSAFSKSIPAMKDYPDLYSKLWSETFTKIVTGSADIDEWDTYVEKFYKQGGKELTEQANQVWKAQ